MLNSLRDIALKPQVGLDPRDTVKLLWTDIGMRMNLRAPLANLLVSGVVAEDDKTQICVDLAAHVTSIGKRALLIDLDRQGSRFKTTLGYDTNAGFTDLCYKLFDEPFFSRSAKDYGLADLLTLFSLKSRTGRLSFATANGPTVKITFSRGRPVEIEGSGDSLSGRVMNAAALLRPESAEILPRPDGTLSSALAGPTALIKARTFTPSEMAALFENHAAAIIDEILERPAGLFEYADLPAESLAEAEVFLPETPPYLGRFPGENGFIARQIENFCVTASAGFKFMPHGQFPIKSGEVASRYRRLTPLLRAFFDVVIVNAPSYPGHALSREMARIADGTLLVVKSGAIDRKGFGKILNDMRENRVNLLGAILNDVETEPRHFL